jgi:hypothetical protein
MRPQQADTTAAVCDQSLDSNSTIFDQGRHANNLYVNSKECTVDRVTLIVLFTVFFLRWREQGCVFTMCLGSRFSRSGPSGVFRRSGCTPPRRAIDTYIYCLINLDWHTLPQRWHSWRLLQLQTKMEAADPAQFIKCPKTSAWEWCYQQAKT